MALTPTFDRFAQELADRLQVARGLGWSREQIARTAAQVGDYLAQHVDPQSPEQRLLKEMWQVADSEEQQAIASALVKMVERHHQGRRS